jgi:outer membrane biosynthesis protein TonB
LRRVLLLFALLLAAGPSPHRARADRAEALGRMREAALELEAAWEEEQAPDLLYRLGLARRKLKEYAKAREAFRAYLRVAPEGGLREEVTRQLVKLDVLMEAEAENYPEEGDRRAARKKKPPAAPAPAPAPAAAPAVPAPVPESVPAVVPAPVTEPVPAAVPVRVPESVPAAVPVRVPESVPSVAPVPVPEPVAPPPPVPPPADSPREMTVAAAVPPSAAPVAPPAVAPAPAAPRSRAGPWLAIGGVAALGAGAFLWWDGARVARDLDARYASGDLSAADRPLFGRARGESIGGRVLVAAGALLVAGAVVTW